MYEDVTRERRTAEQLMYLAERDSLTGLFNRHRFKDELSRMISNAERRGSPGGLILMDLDEFKFVNDSYGHQAGDALLARLASELRALVREGEMSARIGGDEFAVLSAGLAGARRLSLCGAYRACDR